MAWCASARPSSRTHIPDPLLGGMLAAEEEEEFPEYHGWVVVHSPSIAGVVERRFPGHLSVADMCTQLSTEAGVTPTLIHWCRRAGPHWRDFSQAELLLTLRGITGPYARYRLRVTWRPREGISRHDVAERWCVASVAPSFSPRMLYEVPPIIRDLLMSCLDTMSLFCLRGVNWWGVEWLGWAFAGRLTRRWFILGTDGTFSCCRARSEEFVAPRVAGGAVSSTDPLHGGGTTDGELAELEPPAP